MAETKVRMRHPKLPGREIQVRERGVKARERAGWLRVEDRRPATPTAGASKKGDS